MTAQALNVVADNLRVVDAIRPVEYNAVLAGVTGEYLVIADACRADAASNRCSINSERVSFYGNITAETTQLKADGAPNRIVSKRNFHKCRDELGVRKHDAGLCARHLVVVNGRIQKKQERLRPNCGHRADPDLYVFKVVAANLDILNEARDGDGRCEKGATRRGT